ncbi:MAG: RNA polymerase sigma factor [Thermoanaerobaculia bacterium]
MSPRKPSRLSQKRDDLFAGIYNENYGLLMALAQRRYGIPPSEAEALVHEVFVGLLIAGDTIRSARPWLVGAVCHASRSYWRKKKRERSLAEGERERRTRLKTAPAETESARLTIGKMLRGLPARQRESLRLRYFEGCTIREVARELGTTERYAAKLVAKAIRRAYVCSDPPPPIADAIPS